MANVDEIERRLHLLRRKLDAGAISVEQFASEVEKLHFTDGTGRQWMIGAQSGRWYYYDGQKWVQAEPPRSSHSHKAPRQHKPSTADYDTTRVLVKSPARKGKAKAPVMLAFGCGLLIVLVLVLAALLIGVGGLGVLIGEGPRPTPTRLVVMPLPELNTATPTPPPAIGGETTPTPVLAADAQVLLSEADNLLAKSQYAAAAIRYKRATELQPSLAIAYARWAKALRLGYPPKAEEALAKAVVATRLDPNNAEAQTELAWDQFALGRMTEALSAAERAVNLDPRYADAVAAMAAFYLANNRAAEGATKAQLALQLNPNSAVAHKVMADALAMAGQQDAALEQYQAAVRLEPQVALRYLDLGMQLHRMKRFEEAIKAYEMALSLDPGLVPAYDGAGRAYFSGPGDFDKALAYFKKAIEMDEKNALALSGAGYALLMKGERQESLEAFKKALDLRPDLAEAKEGWAKAQLLASTPGAKATAVVLREESATPQATRSLVGRPPATPGAPADAKAAGLNTADAAKQAAPPQAGEQKPAPPLTGRIIYPVFHNDQANYDIYMRTADGQGNAQFVIGEASQPAASWDGKQLAFRRWKRDGRGIVAMDLTGLAAGGNYRRLTAQSFVEDSLPAFSPDGSTVIFSSRRESDRQCRLYRAPASGGEDKALEQNFKPVLGTNPTWLKDGRVLYTGCIPGACGLIAINPDGSNPVAITDNGTDTAAAGSPDGQRIAFMSQREGNWNVYVCNVDGSGLKRVSSSHGDNGLPAWSPDGQYIAYVSNGDGAWAMWVVGADGSNPRKLFDIEGSIDGRVAGEDSTKSRGWLEERISWIP